MNINFKNVLVLAPHTDDGELGLGGTINYFIENDVNVYYVAFSTADKSLPGNLPKDILQKEVKLATHKLGIKKENLLFPQIPIPKNINSIKSELEYHYDDTSDEDFTNWKGHVDKNSERDDKLKNLGI